MTNHPTERQARINDLHTILDLFEKHPELPMPNRFIGLTIFGTDAEAFATLDGIATTLREAGFEVTDETTDERRRVRVDVGRAYFYATHTLDVRADLLDAQMSYMDNVQVDAKPEAVSV